MRLDDDRPAATDALFDTSDLAMAERYGAVARERLYAGRALGGAAVMAFSYANRELLAREKAAAVGRVLEFNGGRRGGKQHG